MVTAASQGLYRPLWSDRILAEAQRLPRGSEAILSATNTGSDRLRGIAGISEWLEIVTFLSNTCAKT